MKNKLIAGLIGLMLIVAAVAGFIILFNKIEPSLSKGDSTSVSTTSAPTTSVPSTSASTTSTPVTSAPTVNDTPGIVYGSNSCIGYSVVNDYTYFFFFYDNDSSKSVFWKAANLQEESSHDIKPYADYDLYIASSYDGLDWELDEYDFHDFRVSSGGRLFVSYTRIFRCTNPDYVLEDLKQNVFSNKDYFNWRVEDAAG